MTLQSWSKRTASTEFKALRDAIDAIPGMMRRSWYMPLEDGGHRWVCSTEWCDYFIRARLADSGVKPYLSCTARLRCALPDEKQLREGDLFLGAYSAKNFEAMLQRIAQTQAYAGLGG